MLKSMNSLQNGGNNQQTFVGFTNYTMTEAFEAFRYHNIPGIRTVTGVVTTSKLTNL